MKNKSQYMTQFKAGYFLESLSTDEYKPLIDHLIGFDVVGLPENDGSKDNDSYCSRQNSKSHYLSTHHFG